MENDVRFLNWRKMLEDSEHQVSIDDDIILLREPVISSYISTPFKVDVFTAIIILEGKMKGRIDLIPYNLETSGIIVLMPGQVLEQEYISPDFKGLFFIMSRHFIDGLNIDKSFSTYISVRNRPYRTIGVQELEAIQLFFDMMFKALLIRDNPYRMEVAHNLTRAFFYGMGYYYHLQEDHELKDDKELLMTRFLELVQIHYKQHRSIGFYADKIHLTPKYLSAVIKQVSGKSAGDWIDEYVILQAKAMLKSTNSNIKQICYELNFPSSSFFGKYFKRLTGMSPKAYRES